MLKLVSDKGRWAVKDKSMIFSNVIWIEPEDIKKYKYILLDDDGNDLGVRMADYVVDD
jgi:hypothetical protein